MMAPPEGQSHDQQERQGHHPAPAFSAQGLERFNGSRAVVSVSKSLLRVMNKDFEFAGIPKVDENGKFVHLHA